MPIQLPCGTLQCCSRGHLSNPDSWKVEKNISGKISVEERYHKFIYRSVKKDNTNEFENPRAYRHGTVSAKTFATGGSNHDLVWKHKSENACRQKGFSEESYFHPRVYLFCGVLIFQSVLKNWQITKWFIVGKLKFKYLLIPFHTGKCIVSGKVSLTWY